MPPAVDLFFSFRSPYSYLALHKTMRMVEDYDIEVRLRAVYPLAVRVPGFFKRADPRFARYVVRDAMRVAEHEGIPFRFPRPDPIVQNMTTLEVAAEQPHIHRLTRLAAAAQLENRSLAFTAAIAPVLWDGRVSGWNEGDHLARAAHAAGFDLGALDAAITAEPDRHEAVIADNERDHAASGHWGVPTFVFEGEPFFGQDRIDLLIWRMTQKGLTRRT
ncbi:DsbA family protein [Bradyrhizobium sp. U87765 SZCCT0131]|uniref:2-hydroxychromene-2-carboxylate isomerase n=1 Tax=unclassified Bradyrhizobium TaxID=2631580 RepID=UPI001BAE1D7E|nr:MULTISPECIES: DsbA family protein [unclassified Bradyrhizobium]MBR1217651.1 DsbA family protein [Bradyrhizobium sp. U87765 SZCCT0131]MBR1261403.1 DsbA family protein [Bradyrhizobium sp. U87765 SZCCT0134]MBR1303149.1 DsbA family protein [Bradyrhizobium sp. U87765 SZCCT0110]MBR1318755.1 DsbA family protein [Bradyrhizobium sp. U87765 SZCCT0109]MBR1347080.1 DsbA family protein [Bradyrhizobium sp. U87765 SZCCT0048]